MVKHVILWTLRAELVGDEREAVKQGIKQGLEALKGRIPGLIDIKVNIDCLASSNADVMLDSTLESEEALKNYAVHPGSPTSSRYPQTPLALSSYRSTLRSWQVCAANLNVA